MRVLKKKSVSDLENCTKLTMAWCNYEVLKKPSCFQKSKDVKMAIIERAISASATTNTKKPVICCNAEAAKDIPVIVSKATDALAIMRHGSYGMSFDRLVTLAHTLKSEYSALNYQSDVPLLG